jgi:hypothetical protein
MGMYRGIEAKFPEKGKTGCVEAKWGLHYSHGDTVSPVRRTTMTHPNRVWTEGKTQ